MSARPTTDPITRHRARSRAIAGLLGVAALVLLLPAAPGATRATLSHPEIQVGGFPTGIALDTATDTIYVGNGTTGTLSLIDGKSCNGGNAHGCNRHVTAVTAGVDPIGIAVDRTSDTVYVANASGTVAVVDARHCNAANTSGCHVEPASVHVGVNPQFLAVDEKTHTIYVANSVSNTVSVIDGRHCNATGEERLPPRASIDPGWAGAVRRRGHRRHGLRRRSRRADRCGDRFARLQRRDRHGLQAQACDRERRQLPRGDRRERAH